MPDHRLDAIRRAETVLLSIVLAIAVIGITIMPLTTPAFVRALVIAVDAEQRTGLGRQLTLEAAEAVRLFVVDSAPPSLPDEMGGQPAFDGAAFSHLIDVRRVMIPARRLALVMAALFAVWVLIRRRTERGRCAIGVVLRMSGWILLGVAGLGVAAGLADFDVLFTWFHGLFFEPGTWVFPDSALLIRVFPLPFWVAAGAVWGGLVLLSAGLLFTSSRRLCFTRGKYGV